MTYESIDRKLKNGGVVILDGGTGTELERRHVPMDPQAWCGPATLEHVNILEDIHRDYIAAGADVITANTYASSRLMLNPAGLADRFDEINRTAVAAAHRARDAGGRDGILVAGSLSHMLPMVSGTAKSDLDQMPSEAEMRDAFAELAALLHEEGCDLILLEMMYHPDRMNAAFQAVADASLPVWAGFSGRRGKNGQPVSFASDIELPVEEMIKPLGGFDIAAAGIMHTPSDLVGDVIAIMRKRFSGPLMAYPDSGYFKMPHWQFENVISQQALLDFATGWIAGGVQIIGGCCGLSPAHIAAIASLKDRTIP